MYTFSPSALTLLRTGGGALSPLQGFLVLLANAARYSAHTRRLFLIIYCAHFRTKMLGQVRSHHQNGFNNPTSEKLAITS